MKPRNYWTKERCREEALKYKNKKEYRNGNNGSYNAAYRKGWLNDVCSHMVKKNK